MMLFYVCSEGGCDPGDDEGLIISAHNANEAAYMWVKHKRLNDPIVFRIPPVSPIPMIHEWHISWDKRGAQKMTLSDNP